MVHLLPHELNKVWWNYYHPRKEKAGWKTFKELNNRRRLEELNGDKLQAIINVLLRNHRQGQAHNLNSVLKKLQLAIRENPNYISAEAIDKFLDDGLPAARERFPADVYFCSGPGYAQHNKKNGTWFVPLGRKFAQKPWEHSPAVFSGTRAPFLVVEGTWQTIIGTIDMLKIDPVAIYRPADADTNYDDTAATELFISLSRGESVETNKQFETVMDSRRACVETSAGAVGGMASSALPVAGEPGVTKDLVEGVASIGEKIHDQFSAKSSSLKGVCLQLVIGLFQSCANHETSNGETLGKQELKNKAESLFKKL